MSTSSLSSAVRVIKSYFHDDARRFPVVNGALPSLSALRQLLIASYGLSGDTAHKLILKYPDEDGDHISIVSEQDWKECVQTVQDAKQHTIRVYLHVTGGSSTPVVPLTPITLAAPALTTSAPAQPSLNVTVTPSPAPAVSAPPPVTATATSSIPKGSVQVEDEAEAEQEEGGLRPNAVPATSAPTSPYLSAEQVLSLAVDFFSSVSVQEQLPSALCTLLETFPGSAPQRVQEKIAFVVGSFPALKEHPLIKAALFWLDKKGEYVERALAPLIGLLQSLPAQMVQLAEGFLRAVLPQNYARIVETLKALKPADLDSAFADVKEWSKQPDQRFPFCAIGQKLKHAWCKVGGAAGCPMFGLAPLFAGLNMCGSTPAPNSCAADTSSSCSSSTSSSCSSSSSAASVTGLPGVLGDIVNDLAGSFGAFQQRPVAPGEDASSAPRSSGNPLFDIFAQVANDSAELINRATGNATPKERKENTVHPNIICDGCGVTPIPGIRYKCTVCNDFDLCSNCEAKNTHPANHALLKMHPPQERERGCGRWRQGGRHGHGNWHGPGPHGPHGPHGHGPHGWRHGFPGPFQGPPPPPPFHGGFPFHGPHHGPPHAPHQHPHPMWAGRCAWRQQAAQQQQQQENSASPAPVAQPPAPSARFVADETIADRSEQAANSILLKKWRVENNGVAQWPQGSKLIFLRGDRQLVAQEEFDVPLAKPGESVELTAVLNTPATPGRYQAYFRLANAERVPFGERVWTDLFVVSKQEEPVAPVQVPEPVAPVQVPEPVNQFVPEHDEKEEEYVHLSDDAPASESQSFSLTSAASTPVPVGAPAADTAPVAAAPESASIAPAAAASKYAVQLQALANMGFANQELNEYLLTEHDGNLVATANWLLNQQMK